MTEPDLLILDDAAAAARAPGPRRVPRRDPPGPRRDRLTTLVLTDDPARPSRLADRLAVMDLGRIVQFGPAHEVYNRPADAFVARFLGPTNLLQGQVEGQPATSAARWSSGRRSAG